MTHHLLRPAPYCAAHLYDVLTDDGAEYGVISRPDPDTWRFALKKSGPILTAPSLQSLRIAMRTHAAQEATK